ncbi:PhzF family phenazine biosynthesis protein [Paenibacillus apis]|uniref:PhzF family phenazine biosynthesis protein n=1 Tax=Paenibacillus apis TaxID=1792174 RepID=A0A920CKK7_9BACL|nr:PhzF family phenazine biosynthesis protein [Paenibacillus apis]GIO40644.1 hypothetical protein J41TS4_04020 [Paenibacillus apis]
MKYYVVDAFSEQLFKGNPAGVCISDSFPDARLMQNIAMENNLSETAFLVPREQQGHFDLKWYTPELEIELCGHATIASAYVVHHHVDSSLKEISFHTLSGVLTISVHEPLYELDFPSRPPVYSNTTELLEEVLGSTPVETFMTVNDIGIRYYAVLENELQVRSFAPDFAKIKAIPGNFGLVLTAKGDKEDFVSRFFAPAAGVNEDPVTGSIHTTLIPYWTDKLGKSKLIARQVSKRGGVLYCEHKGERVKIGGHAIQYLEGELLVGPTP